MQRSLHNTTPPRQGSSQQTVQQNSPALVMAKRIRAEQGTERAREYLAAMEPFVAPAERLFIADQLGVQLPRTEKQTPPQNNNFNANSANIPFNMPQGGMNNPMQLVQMLSSLGGMSSGSGKKGMDPMMLMQLLGGMGKK